MTCRSPLARLTALALPVLLRLFALPLPAGAYEIGHTSITFVDPARNSRQILTEVYYPALVAGENVPVADPAGAGFPVVAFGHGYLLTYNLYAYLWEALVPQGFILALPRTEGSLFPSHEQFGLDLAYLIGAVQARGNDPSSPFYGKVGSTSAVAGHSMGGGASFLAARANPNVTALFNLAAAETNPSAIAAAADITDPALLFSGAYDCVAPPEAHQIPMYEALAADCKTLASLTGGSHCQFAEQSTICELGEGSCSDPLITRDEQHALTVQLLGPWLRHMLKHEPGAWSEFEDLLAGLADVTYTQDCAAALVDAGAPREAPSAGELRVRVTPNPLAGRGTVRYLLPAEGAVAIELLDVSGRRLRTLLDARQSAGWHELALAGRDGRAPVPAAGLYWIRVRAGGASVVQSTLMLD
jgi:predicted dienelactone hydrolase